MTNIRETYKYSRAASDALMSNRYSWRITKSYLDAYGNEEKSLDPVVLDKYIQEYQDMMCWGAITLSSLSVLIPAMWIVKRKIRKRRSAR